MENSIDKLTIGEAKELGRMLAGDKYSAGDFTIGENVMIRTVTHYWTGQVTRETNRFVWVKEAAWIADTGRFNRALKQGEAGLSEVEPVEGEARIGKGAIIDITEWKHALPRTEK